MVFVHLLGFFFQLARVDCQHCQEKKKHTRTLDSLFRPSLEQHLKAPISLSSYKKSRPVHGKEQPRNQQQSLFPAFPDTAFNMQIPQTPRATSPSDSTPKIDFSGLSAILEAARIKNGVPGMSVAVMYKGDVIFAEGFGKRNEHQPFTKEVHLTHPSNSISVMEGSDRHQKDERAHLPYFPVSVGS